MEKDNFSLFNKNNNPHLKKIIDKNKANHKKLRVKKEAPKANKLTVMSQEILALSTKTQTLQLNLTEGACAVLAQILPHLSYILLLVLQIKKKIIYKKKTKMTSISVAINKQIIRLCAAKNISVDELINVAGNELYKNIIKSSA